MRATAFRVIAGLTAVVQAQERYRSNHATYANSVDTLNVNADAAYKYYDLTLAASEAGDYVGNGPFVLKEWRFNDRVETVKNPLYWNAAHVKLNGVRFVPVENFYTETRGFLAGQLHTTYQLPPPLVDKIKAEHPQFLRQEPYLATDFIRTNITRPVLDNPKVRMAMSLAIDRKQLCDNILQGNTPCGTITPDLAIAS